MRKKIVSMLLCMTMIAALAAGCGGEESSGDNNDPGTEQGDGDENEEEPGETEADPLREDEGTTITFAHAQGEYLYDDFYAMGDKFEELTGIKVEFIEVPSTDFVTWTTAQFAAGTEPDIFHSLQNAAGANGGGDYFEQGKLADLTPYYEQENVFNGKIWKDCFVGPNALDGCYSADREHLIATAITFATVNLYYNKDAMSDLGLGEEPPATFTEMVDMMEVAKEDGTYIPMSVMNSTQWNLGWLETNFMDTYFSDTDVVEKLDIIVPDGTLDGGEIMLGLKTGVLSYDDPRFEDYFTRMKEMVPYFNEDFNSASWEYEGLFNDGKVLFNFNGGWYPGQVIQNGYAVNYGAVNVPSIDDAYSEFGVATPMPQAYPVGEPGFFITKKCEDEGRLSAAVKFLQFLTDGATGAQMYVDAMMLGTCVDGVEMPEEIKALTDVEYGDNKQTGIIQVFKFNAEVTDKYWQMYSAYLDPASTQSAADFIEDLKAELLPYLDEAIEEYTTADVLSYVDQVQQ